MHRWIEKPTGPGMVPVRQCEECGFKSHKDDPVYPDCESFRRAKRHVFTVGEDFTDPPQMAGRWVHVSCGRCGVTIGMRKGRDPVEYSNELHGEVGTCDQKLMLDVAEVMEL